MSKREESTSPDAIPLTEAAPLSEEKVLNPDSLSQYGGIDSDRPVLVVLAAGKGTRFGTAPKCIQPVHDKPLARHAIDAFRRFGPSPAVCMVGYRHEEVAGALGSDNIYVHSANPAGGTGFAAYEALSVPGLLEANPLVVIAMGDRIVPSAVFHRLYETHRAGGGEADLTFLSAIYEPPKNQGKGRVVRDDHRRVARLVEERDIASESDPLARQYLSDLTEGNCPLYIIRARTLERLLRDLGNDNAQDQYYLTDIIERLVGEGGNIRTITTAPSDPEYDLLCSDVTRAMDLALLEGILDQAGGMTSPAELEAEEVAKAIVKDRPAGQIASIARQLEELLAMAQHEAMPFDAGQSVGIGISGGRLRIAFMHPDMGRFLGPAWQMPIGAGDVDGDEQIIMLVQESDDRHLSLITSNPEYRETVNAIPADSDAMFPGEDVSDLHTYEAFGTQMGEEVLLRLGYFSDDELARRRAAGQPLPPASQWVGSNMRRPFALIGNALASMRTLRTGNLGARVQRHLGQERFKGMRMLSTGNIPQGGFSSSSAVTVATKNAINALYGIGIPADLLVHLACQAEYGTGVRAGSLDQATEQKGKAGEGTLISSNPKDNYRILGTYPVPTDRIQIIFPYSVERDRDAWRWSGGCYAHVPGEGPLTAGETRKMTGKAAELVALVTRLPLDTDFFQRIEEDLVTNGVLSLENRQWICSVLLETPLCITQEALRELAGQHRDWYVEQTMAHEQLDRQAAEEKVDHTVESLFAGWRMPVLRRTTSGGEVVQEEGTPLRAMLAYLFGEVAKNFYMINHSDEWIACVTRSQGGDRCFDFPLENLPERAAMEGDLDWEAGAEGADLLDRWLEHAGATAVDFNRGLDDETLQAKTPPEFHCLEGSSFFRGLALIDLAEAMLKRAFGESAVAVRVNAAGQGDYFQVHVDTTRANVDDVKRFVRAAFYRRFALSSPLDFVELHTGGGAVGIRLSRYDAVPLLVRRLQVLATSV